MSAEHIGKGRELGPFFSVMPCADDYVEDTDQAIAAEVRVGIVCGVAKPLAIAAGDSDHIENVNVKVAINIARAEETSLRSLHEQPRLTLSHADCLGHAVRRTRQGRI